MQYNCYYTNISEYCPSQKINLTRKIVQYNIKLFAIIINTRAKTEYHIFRMRLCLCFSSLKLNKLIYSKWSSFNSPTDWQYELNIIKWQKQIQKIKTLERCTTQFYESRVHTWEIDKYRRLPTYVRSDNIQVIIIIYWSLRNIIRSIQPQYTTPNF